MFALLWTVLSLALIVNVDSRCPDGFQKHNADCYKVLALEASWIEARAYCKMLGAGLAEINSDAEEKLVEGFLQTLHGSHIDELYWIGGSEIVAVNDWRWMREDGKSVPISNYTHWGHNKPDNVGGNENCLVINYHGSKTYWDDRNCQGQHSFICEAR